MKTEQCSHCEREANVITGSYRLDQMGLPVVLKNVELVKCDECGTVEPIIPNLDGLMHSIAWTVISHECRLAGDEIRFLRKYLGLSTTEFTELMHITKDCLSRWENGEDVGAQSDRLIRLVVLSKSKELRQHIEEMMKMFPQLADKKRTGRKPELKIDSKTHEVVYA